MNQGESAGSPGQAGETRKPKLWEALISVIALIWFIREGIVRFETTAHIPLLLATLVAGVIALRCGFQWLELEKGMVEGIALGLKAILILLVVGMLIGTWISSGIVPLMIYHGLALLSPAYFLVAACIICCVVSVATGSSWTTAGTVGIALVGVGQGLQVPLPMVAGAIISGAYFGDKLSPLSDTTNLAPAVAHADLFEHVRYMFYTTIPSLCIALLVYAIMGRAGGAETGADGTVEMIRTNLQNHFNLNPLLYLPPVLVVTMVAWRIPALPALLVGVLFGALMAAALQGTAVKDILIAAQTGYVAKTGFEPVDKLLTRGGLESMLPTVALILCALAFGGLMDRTGQLAVLAQAVLRWATNAGRLVSSTVATCIGMNIFAPDQYLSIVVPGRMFGEAYKRQGLHPKLLSRTLEDAGTLTSPLIPWNTCGAFMASTLGVSTMSYAPYAVFNLVNPLVAIVVAFAGWKIARLGASASPGKDG